MINAIKFCKQLAFENALVFAMSKNPLQGAPLRTCRPRTPNQSGDVVKLIWAVSTSSRPRRNQISIKMNLNETESHNIDPSESPSVYFCPTKPIYTWTLTETAAFYVSITAKSIASPFTVLLNLLIIVAVWRRKALQKNSNILLASMAVADLLVGAVSMPLTTALDILLLRKNLSLTICKIAGANQIVLYSAVSSSLYHLTFIA